MNSPSSQTEILETLRLARKVADYAANLGAEAAKSKPCIVSEHLGAVLADSILQAGLNYRTVVSPRIERIISSFPEAANMNGISCIVENGYVSDFLQWNHSEKIERFIGLVTTLQRWSIQNVGELNSRLLCPYSHHDLLNVPGVGPKTVDYLCCLVGIDSIAIDRHVRFFVKSAGIELKDYAKLKLTVSFAADLLGVSRRGFDLMDVEFGLAKVNYDALKITERYS